MQQDLNMSEQHLDEDQDSQDSNREDHSQNEYPDEEENNLNSSQSSKSENSENEEMDSDFKTKKLKNSIFDKIFKKNKEWSYQNHLSQFKDTGFLDDYEK